MPDGKKQLPAETEFITLDETERKLHQDDLMICNTEGGMCIAGVFGGIKSGVLFPIGPSVGEPFIGDFSLNTAGVESLTTAEGDICSLAGLPVSGLPCIFKPFVTFSSLSFFV